MPKILVDRIPDGFEIRNGKLIKSLQPKQKGGSTGDQSGYGLTTTPNNTRYNSVNTDSDKDVRYSLSSVPREVANIEAEGGETVYTDLSDSGKPGLYDIKGPRHSSGGVPMYLPNNSFIYSDTKSMKMNKGELAEFGINSRKKMTPAKVSKKFDLNQYTGVLESKDSDKIKAKSAELMLNKNQLALSKLALLQEAKKNFKDGVPDAASTFLKSKGIDPQEFSQKIERANQMMMGGMTNTIPQARYGGDLPKYQNAGSVTSGDSFTDPVRKDSKTDSPDYEIVTVRIDGRSFQVPKDLAPYVTKRRGNRPILMYPKSLSSSEKARLAKIANDFGVDNFLQPSNSRYGYREKDVGTTFGGVDYVDLERVAVAGMKVRENPNLSIDEAIKEVEKLSETEVRKKFFDGIGFEYTSDQIKNPSKIYQRTDDSFKSFYNKFANHFGEERFRQALGNDMKIGSEHLAWIYDYYKNPTKPEPVPDETYDDEIDIDLDLQEFLIDTTPIIEPGDLKDVPKKEYTPVNPRFWKQDLLKMNALAQRDRDIFMPWQPEAQAFVPQYILEDPTRALANNNEQLGMGTQALAAFSGPQSFNARASQMQGKAMANASNILAEVNARNVNTVNQGLAREAQARQTIGLENDRRNVKEYDDSNFALQQFINERNVDREQMADLTANAFTNRANTYNLNQLYDYFDILPETGGIIQYNGLSPRYTPTKPSEPMDYTKAYNDIYVGLMDKGMPAVEAAKAAKSIFETQYSNSDNNVSTRLSGKLTPTQIAQMQAGAYSYPGSQQGYQSAVNRRKGGQLKKYVVPFYTGKSGV